MSRAQVTRKNTPGRRYKPRTFLPFDMFTSDWVIRRVPNDAASRSQAMKRAKRSQGLTDANLVSSETSAGLFQQLRNHLITGSRPARTLQNSRVPRNMVLSHLHCTTCRQIHTGRQKLRPNTCGHPIQLDYKSIHPYIDRQTDIQIYRQADRQKDVQKDRHNVYII